ncbi:MAG: GNAT family N-acetyltransferase [Dokdonella sp.]|nr:GNAT family N-acetyltransferase [Dokdonella sp.]
MLQVEFHASLDAIDAAAWDALRPDDNPFLAHAFLAGLERHGCIRARAGWQAHHLSVRDGGRLVAAAPLYLKTNSHGEFVYDGSWAHAHEDHGLHYYPKLVCAVPYSPVPGPRLLVGSAADAAMRRSQLIDAIRAEAQRLGLAAAQVNFTAAADAAAFAGGDWLARRDWQFHWHNDAGWRDFGDFLAALSHKKRNNIRRERAQVAAAGITCQIRHGDELGDADWRALHDFYRGTFDDKGNYAALTLDFLRHLGQALPRQVLAVLCHRQRELIGGALLLRSASTLYGRYWGAREAVAGLHFEACYYQGIDYCLREGLRSFEPGAGGEHKIARGFLPTATHAFHWIADADLREAIAQALRRATPLLDDYRDDVLAHSPYVAPATRVAQ